jgi:hypothetical protein
MLDTTESFHELFDKNGRCLGALLGPEAWALVRQTVLDGFAPAARPVDPIEPMQDWSDLMAFWDFPYPVDRDVTCTVCGLHTDNWEQDEPRKFHLTAANMGGLVTYRCTGCQAKIMKRHFKDAIKVEVRPFQEEKGVRNLGRSK